MSKLRRYYGEITLMKSTLEKYLNLRIKKLRKFRSSLICSEIHKERLNAKLEAFEEILDFIGGPTNVR